MRDVFSGGRFSFVKWLLNWQYQPWKSKAFERQTLSLWNCCLFPFILCLWVVVDAWSASLIYGRQTTFTQMVHQKLGSTSCNRLNHSFDCKHRWIYTKWAQTSTSHREEGLMIGYFLIVVGTTISIANPVVEAAEVAGPKQKESKT